MFSLSKTLRGRHFSLSENLLQTPSISYFIPILLFSRPHFIYFYVPKNILDLQCLEKINIIGEVQDTDFLYGFF